jgi:hypothetical protein
MIYSREAFVDYTTLDILIPVETTSGIEILGVGISSVILYTNQEGRIRRVRLTDVLHVLGVARSLISVSQLEDRGITTRTLGAPKHGIIFELSGDIVASASRVGKSYVLDCVPAKRVCTFESAIVTNADDSQV